MKSRSTKTLIIALAVLLVGAGAVAVSQTVKRVHARGEFGFGGRMMGFFADYLDLTDAQRAQVKDIMAKEKTTMQPLMQQLSQSHQQLRTLEESATFDEAKVRALAAQNTQLMTELIVQKARIKNELFQVLTPEQKAKMAKFEDRRESRFKKHMQEDAPAPPAE
jgi:P pilus assembly/Cpx signaling pathway, periplasmic inhibitor/zinc-resistance associated protein